MSILKTDPELFQKAFPFWEKLTPEQKMIVKSNAVPQHFSVGESMHRGSADCAGLYAVLSGQVRAYIISESGREITLFRLFERDICIFSASCMMKNIRFEIFMQAVQETDTLLLPTPVYQQLNRSSIAVADYTSQILSSRLSDVMWLMEQILFMSFDRRLALFLLEQSAASDGVLTVTHEEIAQDMGTAREVVTRMLKYFQTEGVVTLSRGKIEVKDRRKLEKMAESRNN